MDLGIWPCLCVLACISSCFAVSVHIDLQHMSMSYPDKYLSVCVYNIHINIYIYLYVQIKNTQLHKNLQLGISFPHAILLQIIPTHFLRIFHSRHTVTPSNTPPASIPGNFKIHTEDSPHTLASQFLEPAPTSCILDPTPATHSYRHTFMC